MAYQMNEKQGSLFKNEKANDRQPDLRGSIMINGVSYNLSGWYRTSKNGLQYISLQASDNQAYTSTNGTERQAAYTRPPQRPEPASSGAIPPPSVADIPEDNFPF